MEETGTQLAQLSPPVTVEDGGCEVGDLVMLREERGDKGQQGAGSAGGRTLFVEKPEQLDQAVAAGSDGQHPYHMGQLTLILLYVPNGVRVPIDQLLPQLTHVRCVTLCGALLGLAPCEVAEIILDVFHGHSP